MNMLRQTSLKMLTMFLCFIAIGTYGQDQRKTFTETFSVSKDAVLDINTSHADIEFETWGKNEVEVEAIIEIEGATDEEADKYFESLGLEIVGNSKKVSIAMASKNKDIWPSLLGDAQNFHIEMPEFPEVHAFSFDFDFDELSNIPIPPMVEFDHEAFKKDGEAYLKKWQKEFEESYDEEHMKKLEEWAERVEEKQEKRKVLLEKRMEKRKEMEQKRGEKINERNQKIEEARAARMAAYQNRRDELLKRSKLKISNDSDQLLILESDGTGKPSIFYSSSGGLNKNFKVTKTIKVKMPKGMKIKMNVRHGEVKLAENTKNLNATLSHSSLWASTIDGDKTTINASYSPVNVDRWNYGQLQAKYAENVALKEVLNLRLNATSSDVTIDRLINSAFIKNDFGPITIKSISNNFQDIDISLQNAELNCSTPNVPFTIYVNGTSSKLTSPAKFTFDRTKNHNTIIHRGYFKNKNAESSLIINAKFSDVVLE